jgi:hypothetical protein
MRILHWLVVVLTLGMACVAHSQDFTHRAENNVPVTLVKMSRQAQYTEVQLRADVDLKDVCWTSSGDNSPYLLADGRRYRFLQGGNITPCPDRRGYSAGEVMSLRFEPLPSSVRQFSLVEGKGGENQMADPASQPGVRYWNFLRVPLP